MRGINCRLRCANVGLRLGRGRTALLPLFTRHDVGIDEFIGTVSLTSRQTGLRFGSRQRGLCLLERGAIGSVIDSEQYLALFHFLAVGVIHFIDVAGNTRAQLDAFHRFNSAVKAIPLTDGFHYHVSGAHRGRLWDGVLCNTVIASDKQHGEEHRSQCCQMNVNPGFLQAHYFYSGYGSRRTRRSGRRRATSFVRTGLRLFVSFIATKL
ncbi:hypothetical protein D3C80_1188200 [compost metagenome]